jgi:excisionase family DNA binding protein
MSVKTPEHLVHGVDGPVVILSSRVAAYLYRHLDLDSYRRDHRGEDPEVDNALISIGAVAAQWHSSATGTKRAAKPELPATLEWLSSTEAAGLLQMTDRGIRKAIAEGHLKATSVTGRWRITRADLAHYKTTRSEGATTWQASMR